MFTITWIMGMRMSRLNWPRSRGTNIELNRRGNLVDVIVGAPAYYKSSNRIRLGLEKQVEWMVVRGS
jgi:hypothetical protein